VLGEKYQTQYPEPETIHDKRKTFYNEKNLEVVDIAYDSI